MAINYKEVMHRINCLNADVDSLYHQAALRLGMSDSVLLVLYSVNEKGGKCPIGRICGETGISKQTLNSALRKLEGEGIIYLEPNGGKTKTICLTERGAEYVKLTIGRLFSAECSTFAEWTEDEINEYLRLLEKYNNDFKKRIEKL